jgi:DNA-directed RNA polymerase II subunit RPB2
MSSSGICQPPGSTVSASGADIAQKAYQSYFDEYPTTFLTQHHVESYEAFMFQTLPDLLHAENKITVLNCPLTLRDNSTLYKYKTEIFVGGDVSSANDLQITVSAPAIVLDGAKTVRRMFPNEARLRNLTYSTILRADIHIRTSYYNIVEEDSTDENRRRHTLLRNTDPPKQVHPSELDAGTRDFITPVVKTIVLPNYPLMKIPILLRSKFCATYGADKAMLTEMGECRNEQGGYFIIDGAEKLLITRQEQAFNTIFVQLKPESDPDIKTFASVNCKHPVTQHSRRVALYRLKKNSDKKKEGGGDSERPVAKNVTDDAIRASIPNVTGDIPLFCLFRALGVESDEDIVRMILPDTQSPQTSAMEARLIASIHDAYPIQTRAHAIEFIYTLTKGGILASALDILNEHVFSHVPNEPLARAQYLAEMVRKMLRVEMNLEPPTNRDDIRNQRLLPTGSLMSGLIGECLKDWKKKVVMTIDTAYNGNKTLYKDSAYTNMFDQTALATILNINELNTSIMRGYRGKWGTNQFNTKTGVIQPVARISFMDAMSHTRRVISDFDTSLKLTGPRHLHTSQVGYFCTAETPTGAHIGATKNMSILTAISIPAYTKQVVTWLLSRGGVIQVSSATAAESATLTSVQINGGTIGFTSTPVQLTRVLKFMKWTACLPPTASVSFNTFDNIIRIYLDDGRPLRPLWHLNDGKFPDLPAVMPTWRELVCGTLPATRAHGIYSTAFVDPFDESEVVTLEDYERTLFPHVGKIEYVDPYEGNEAYVSWWGRDADLTPQHTHAEIHPSSLMGVLASMIPFANHNQSPRNQLSCSQSKQGIGYYATNYDNRFDTYGSMLCYGEGGMCRTIVHEAVGGGGMPYGTNVIFCINSFNGYNQDDGILFNRSSIERGLFRSLALRSYSTVEEDDPISKATYRIANPKNILKWTDLKPGVDYSALDDSGIIKEGALITDNTALVGRYIRNPETGVLSDASLTPSVFTKGRVDKVVVLNQANGMKLVHVRIFEERIPELGDKFSTRHGQKGTIGMLLNAEDMPRTADGMVPDVVVNPHCIPSRMTIAQILEQVFGKYGAVVGAKMNATSFMNDEQSYNAIADALQELGLQREGEEIMYSGMTGQMFTSSVFIGPMYFMRLKHLTSDKMNSRATGRKEIRTHQPTGGRGSEGGMRIGEMERDSLIAHASAAFLQESMMKRSDGTTIWVCNGCGTIPIFNESAGLFVCPLCDGPLKFQGDSAANIGLILPIKRSRVSFSRIEIPYALKLLDQELTTFMNGGLRFLTEKNARTFREPAAVDESTVVTAEAVREPVREPAAEPERVADNEEEGLPERNIQPRQNVVAPGDTVIRFGPSEKQYKEFDKNYAFKIKIGDDAWSSVEHYYQAQKYPSDVKYKNEILAAKTAAAATTIGTTKEKLAPLRSDWSTARIEVMLTALRAKFGDAYPKLRDKLLSTKNAKLLYVHSRDNYWGTGPEGKKTIGQNKLGELLMQVRSELFEAKAAAAAPPPVPAPVDPNMAANPADELMGVPAVQAEIREEEAAAANNQTITLVMPGAAAPGAAPVVEPAAAEPFAVPQQQNEANIPVTVVNPAAAVAENSNEQMFVPPEPAAALPPQPQAGGGPPVLNIQEISAITVPNIAVEQGAPPTLPEPIDPDIKVVEITQPAGPGKK